MKKQNPAPDWPHHLSAAVSHSHNARRTARSLIDMATTMSPTTSSKTWVNAPNNNNNSFFQQLHLWWLPSYTAHFTPTSCPQAPIIWTPHSHNHHTAWTRWGLDAEHWAALSLIIMSSNHFYSMFHLVISTSFCPCNNGGLSIPQQHIGHAPEMRTELRKRLSLEHDDGLIAQSFVRRNINFLIIPGANNPWKHWGYRLDMCTIPLFYSSIVYRDRHDHAKTPVTQYLLCYLYNKRLTKFHKTNIYSFSIWYEVYVVAVWIAILYSQLFIKQKKKVDPAKPTDPQDRSIATPIVALHSYVYLHFLTGCRALKLSLGVKNYFLCGGGFLMGGVAPLGWGGIFFSVVLLLDFGGEASEGGWRSSTKKWSVFCGGGWRSSTKKVEPFPRSVETAPPPLFFPPPPSKNSTSPKDKNVRKQGVYDRNHVVSWVLWMFWCNWYH